MAEGAPAGRGVRGYIVSRPVNGVAYPHRVQNLVVRDYCQRNGLRYLLSATETSIPECFMILSDVLAELDKVDGIVLFSQFTLPADKAHRARIYERVMSSGGSLHAALENTAITAPGEIAAFEEVLRIAPALAQTPFGGAFPGKGAILDRGAFET